VVIGCNGVNSTSFVSTYAMVGETVNGVTAFGAPILLKAGLASYHNPSTGNSRWGDYSTTSVDPNNPNIFWTIQMYRSGFSIWSTQITEVRTSPLELLAAIGAAPAKTAFFLGLFLAWTRNAGCKAWRKSGHAPRANGGSSCIAKSPQPCSTLFLRWEFIVVMGVLWAVGLWLIGIDYPLLFGVLGGLVEVVP